MDVKTVVTTIVAITIGILLIGNLLVPEADSVMNQLTDLGHSNWASLIGVVVVVTVISLVVVALYAYS